MEILHLWQSILPYLFGILAIAGYQFGGLKSAFLPLFGILIAIAYRIGILSLTGAMNQGAAWFFACLLSFVWLYLKYKRRQLGAKTSRFKTVLEQHGMTLKTYQPPISSHDELEDALFFFANSRHIIFDREGNVVGRFLLADIKDIK